MPLEQRFAFDEVADIYDRARPGYPEALFEDLVSLSAITAGGRILEIGCGTGKATVALARRGFRVRCLEPGPALARLARDRVGESSSVEILPYTFEAWPLEAEAFGLVMAAQSFHWIAPEVRFRKAAAVLRGGGSLAIFGNATVPGRSPVQAAIDRAYSRHAPAMPGPNLGRWHAEPEMIRQLFAASRCFGEVLWRRYPWAHQYTPDGYAELLSTQSDHQLLPERQRHSLLAEIRRAIEDDGGILTIEYEAHLYVARRLSDGMNQLTR